MSFVRSLTPLLASLALAACADSTIGDAPGGPDAGSAGGGGSGGEQPDANVSRSVDADTGGGGGGGGGGGELDAAIDPDGDVEGDPDAAIDADIDAAVDAAVDAEPDPEPEPFSITHSLDLEEIISGNSVSCIRTEDGDPVGHRQNRFYREFVLADFGLSGDVFVEEIDFGIELARSGDEVEDQPLALFVHRLDGDLAFDNLEEEPAGGFFDVPDVEQVIGTVTFDQGVAFDESDILVVEIVAPDGTDDGNFFFIGSNDAGETDDSYWKAHPCGIDDITPYDEAGEQFEDFPENIHVLMEIRGEAEQDGSSALWAIGDGTSGHGAETVRLERSRSRFASPPRAPSPSGDAEVAPSTAVR